MHAYAWSYLFLESDDKSNIYKDLDAPVPPQEQKQLSYPGSSSQSLAIQGQHQKSGVTSLEFSPVMQTRKQYTVKPRLADTPEMQTPRLCEHFIKSQPLALFYLYKLPLEMRTPRYSVFWTAPSAPPYTTLYISHPRIRTFRSAASKWLLPELHHYL